MCRVCSHRSCRLRRCWPGRKDVGVLPWNSVLTQAGATAILSVNGPERFRMKRPAPSDRRTIPEGSHWVVLCVDETEHTRISGNSAAIRALRLGRRPRCNIGPLKDLYPLSSRIEGDRGCLASFSRARWLRAEVRHLFRRMTCSRHPECWSTGVSAGDRSASSISI